MQYEIGLLLGSVDEILRSATIQIKATEQYFPVVLYYDLHGGF